MLTAQENERLTRVGPGTPMGNLLRRYWQPVAGIDEMSDRWTKRVKILGEELVLFKKRPDIRPGIGAAEAAPQMDRTGRFGLIGEACPHRRASLAYGIPTEDGIRCPYHGWKFDGAGRCLEQPNEPEGSTFKDKVSLPGYPVEELGGLLWAYLGPQPAPLIPRYDGFVDAVAIRHIGQATLPCNWLQMMENSVDIVHTEWLHGILYEFLREQSGEPTKVAISRHHAKIAFDEFPYGIIKRRLMEGQSEDSDDWKVGHPLVFPNMLAVGSGGGLWKQYTFQIRVPIDDVSTQHWWYHAFVPPKGANVPQHLLDRVPVYDVPYLDEHGEYMLHYIHVQDIMAWITQGPIADRTQEALNSTDRGVTLYRNMLKREMEKVERGEDPIATLRDPAQNVCIELPLEKGKDMFNDGFANIFRRHMSAFSPIAEDILAVFAQERAARERDLAAR
jgi:5,5'-dehydrodivanillate O-demethylase